MVRRTIFKDNNDDYTDGNGTNIIDEDKEIHLFIISRYKRVNHRLASKEEELKLIKEIRSGQNISQTSI